MDGWTYTEKQEQMAVEFPEANTNILARNWVNWWQWKNCLSLGNKDVPEAEFFLE